MDRDPSSAWKIMGKGLVHGYNSKIYPNTINAILSFWQLCPEKNRGQTTFLGRTTRNRSSNHILRSGPHEFRGPYPESFDFLSFS
jgi:hypothetical protein